MAARLGSTLRYRWPLGNLRWAGLGVLREAEAGDAPCTPCQSLRWALGRGRFQDQTLWTAALGAHVWGPSEVLSIRDSSHLPSRVPRGCFLPLIGPGPHLSLFIAQLPCADAEDTLGPRWVRTGSSPGPGLGECTSSVSPCWAKSDQGQHHARWSLASKIFPRGLGSSHPGGLGVLRGTGSGAGVRVFRGPRLLPARSPGLRP